MTVSEALSLRKSTRAFLDKPVDKEIIIRILEAAGHAPSGTNTQPWQVAVVTGDRKLEIESAIEKAFKSGDSGNMDYQYYPKTWVEPYNGRRKACGIQLYTALSIAKEDMESRLKQWVANFRAFDAPVALYFFLDSIMGTGSYLDYGMFLQSIMLAAVEEGLATCPQAALAQYPAIVKDSLGYPEDSILICGMALGYEDSNAKVNSYRTSREKVETFTQFFE